MVVVSVPITVVAVIIARIGLRRRPESHVQSSLVEFSNPHADVEKDISVITGMHKRDVPAETLVCGWDDTKKRTRQWSRAEYGARSSKEISD